MELFSSIAAPLTSDWDVERIGTIIDELIYQLEAGSLIINSSFRNICTATIRPVYLFPYFCAYAVPDSIHLSVRVQGSQKCIKILFKLYCLWRRLVSRIVSVNTVARLHTVILTRKICKAKTSLFRSH